MKLRQIAMLAGAVLLAQGCARHGAGGDEKASRSLATQVATGSGNGVVEIRAAGRTFQGPTRIPSGWTTFRFVNASSMIHFALVDVPPPGVTIDAFSRDVGLNFQAAMDAMNAGDDAAVQAAFARFPAWIADLAHNGGPGLLSPGRTGQTTVYMKPGHYFLECYVKSDGVFHSTSPGDGKIGMMLDLTVTPGEAQATEPTANVTLAVTNAGFSIVDGQFHPGTNTIRVNFIEQQALPSFVGNDVHLMKVDDADSIRRADAWLDWRAKDGLEDPSPVTFLGGVNDMPAGEHGYFTVDLQPGDYAFISEMPGPQAAGFVLPISVPATAASTGDRSQG
jgi:uncharacterized cupredoxin-like copper-binding protein